MTPDFSQISFSLLARSPSFLYLSTSPTPPLRLLLTSPAPLCPLPSHIILWIWTLEHGLQSGAMRKTCKDSRALPLY